MGLRGTGQVPRDRQRQAGPSGAAGAKVPKPHCTVVSPDLRRSADGYRERCAGSGGTCFTSIASAFTTTSSSWAVIRSWQLEWCRGCANRLSWRFTFDSCSNIRLLSASAPCSRISQRPRHVMHKLRVRPLTPNKAIWKLLSRQSRVYPKNGCFRAVAAPGVLSRSSCFWT